MTMTPTDPFPDAALPAGATWDNEWWDDEPPHKAYRIVHGRKRSVGETIVHFNGLETGLAEVETSACQLDNGALDPDDPPQIQVHVYRDSGLNAAQAREIAALLLDAADEVDGWASR